MKNNEQAMQPEEIIYVTNGTAVCAGDPGAGAHPQVYLDLLRTGENICPYCSRHFIYRK